MATCSPYRPDYSDGGLRGIKINGDAQVLKARTPGCCSNGDSGEYAFGQGRGSTAEVGLGSCR